MLIKRKILSIFNGNVYHNSPAPLSAKPVPHVNKGRQNVSREVDASTPVEPIEEEGDDKHDVNDFTSQEEEVAEEHPVSGGKPES